MQPHADSRSRMQLRMRDGAAAAWAMNRLRRLGLPLSPGWAPPLPSWRGVGSAQPARLPLFPSPAVADQAPGVAGAEQLRAREALQPGTLGPIFALGPGARARPRRPCQLVEEGRGRIWRHGWLSRTGWRCAEFEFAELCSYVTHSCLYLYVRGRLPIPQTQLQPRQFHARLPAPEPARPSAAAPARPGRHRGGTGRWIGDWKGRRSSRAPAPRPGIPRPALPL